MPVKAVRLADFSTSLKAQPMTCPTGACASHRHGRWLWLMCNSNVQGIGTLLKKRTEERKCGIIVDTKWRREKDVNNPIWWKLQKIAGKTNVGNRVGYISKQKRYQSTGFLMVFSNVPVSFTQKNINGFKCRKVQYIEIFIWNQKEKSRARDSYTFLQSGNNQPFRCFRLYTLKVSRPNKQLSYRRILHIFR